MRIILGSTRYNHKRLLLKLARVTRNGQHLYIDCKAKEYFHGQILKGQVLLNFLTFNVSIPLR